jgi:hypothetical protein
MFGAYGSKTMVLPSRSRTSRVSCATAAAPHIKNIATPHIRSMIDGTERLFIAYLRFLSKGTARPGPKASTIRALDHPLRKEKDQEGCN